MKKVELPYITLTLEKKFTATQICTSNILHWIYKYMVKSVEYNAEPNLPYPNFGGITFKK